jgi:hypothetical protein
VAVAAIVMLTSDTWSARQPWLPHFDGGAGLSALAILAGVAVSVALGLWGRAPRMLALVVNLALVAALVPVVAHNVDPGNAPVQSNDASLVQKLEAIRYQQAQSGLTYNGATVRNVYPYDRRGHLLHDVRLFGDDGRPLDIGEVGGDPTRRPVFTADGEALNAFPIRYREPGTDRVANPDAGPTVDAKPLTSAPLK